MPRAGRSGTGNPEGPAVTHRSSAGPLGPGGSRVPEGFAPGLRGQEALREQALAGEGGRPVASNPIQGVEERGSVLKRSLGPNNSKGEGLDWTRVMPGRINFKILIKILCGILGLLGEKQTNKKKTNQT